MILTFESNKKVQTTVQSRSSSFQHSTLILGGTPDFNAGGPSALLDGPSGKEILHSKISFQRESQPKNIKPQNKNDSSNDFGTKASVLS